MMDSGFQRKEWMSGVELSIRLKQEKFDKQDGRKKKVLFREADDLLRDFGM